MGSEGGSWFGCHGGGLQEDFCECHDRFYRVDVDVGGVGCVVEMSSNLDPKYVPILG